MKIHYEVLVGNIGKVWEGSSPLKAMQTFTKYSELSEAGYGRCANEGVTLWKNGEIIAELEGK